MLQRKQGGASLLLIGQRFSGSPVPAFCILVCNSNSRKSTRQKHKLGLNARFPFGITVREDLSCTPVSSAECRVSYHCSFAFPKGWRGAVGRRMPLDQADESTGGCLLYRRPICKT